ncbi:MAG: NUDIX hydrolase [Firmicutes bacterium]|nr:NUDIX hydrolase [Bacillota bacterium]
MDFTEIPVKSEGKYSGIIVDVRVDTVRLPGGREARREIVEHPGGVAILPLDGAGNAVCVRQYRYAFSEHLLEAPAGKLEPGEDPLESALRELSEETGLTAGRVIPLGYIYPSPGYSREILYIYLALDLKEGAPHPDTDEFLEVLRIPLDELVACVARGEICDAKTVVAVLRAKQVLTDRHCERSEAIQKVL